MRYILTFFIVFMISCNKTEVNGQYLFVFSGESNSGGYAKNSEAYSYELGYRPTIRILNNTTKASFDTLEISAIGDGIDNTHVLHAGSSSWGGRHGWELELANLAANGSLTNPTYVVKTGQGGSKIADWSLGASYTNVITVNPWQDLQNRLDAAISLLQTPNIIFLYSQGINDKIANTDTTTWKNATIAHFAKIRAKYGGNIPILITDFSSISATDMSTYNIALKQIVASNSNNYLISTSGAGLDTDANHWNDAGSKLIADRMINQLKKITTTNGAILKKGASVIIK